MPQLKIMGFDGIVPRESPTMLGDSQAQTALNVKLYSRELRAWRGSTEEYTPLISNVKTIYKYYTNHDPIWLTWNTDVNVVPNPASDSLLAWRLYYTGDGAPKKTNYTMATTGTGAYPRSYMPMGVIAPAAAPTATVVGSGTTNAETRSYVFTYVTVFPGINEESAPSPASTAVTTYTGDSVTINGFESVPSGYGILYRRIYRTVTGASVDTYNLVAEIPIGTTTYSDTLTASQLGEVIPSIGWNEPPTDLSGLIALPGGALAGFSGNTVYFSEPYFPHAWPLSYALNVSYPIVGLGVYGTSIAVLTDRYPFIISGYTPGQMSVERVPILEPCVSKRSITSDETGVVYASPNGLVNIGPASRGVVSHPLFRRDEWQSALPSDIQGAATDGRYFAFYTTYYSTHKTMVMSRDDSPALSTLDLQATAVHIDSKTGNLYYVDPVDNHIRQADADNSTLVTYNWKSKRFMLPGATSFSALKLDADFTVSPGTATVKIYGEGTLVSTTTVSSLDPVRIAPFKYRWYEIEVDAKIPVRSVAIATTVAELHQ